MNAGPEGLTFHIDLRGDRDPRIFVPAEQEVVISYGAEFFQKQGLLKWVDTFELGTAGYRDTVNMENLFATDAPFNGHTILMVAEAMGRIYERRGHASVHLGGEVRRFTAEIIDLVGRVFAARGISVHLHADRDTTPIWASSFGVFYNELDGGANVTASHSQGFKQGFKPMDEKGMQLLDMAGEIREEVRKMGKEAAEGGFMLRLAPSDSPLIRKDFQYLQPYGKYLRMIVPGEALDLIRQAQNAGMKVGADTVGGSMHENSEPIFRDFGITTGPEGTIRYMHWQKRDDFHRVGEIGGEDFGCDPTKGIIYRNIGLKEKLLAGEIHFGFIWDPDGDRYNIVTVADDSTAGKAEGMGLEVERVPGSGRCVVYFKPNQIYFLIAALKLEMLARSEDLFRHDYVIGTTYPTSRSIGELADVFNRRYAEEFKGMGTRVRVFNTPVGFKYFGNMVGEIEQKLAQGGEVSLEDATGAEISLGRRPRILILAEESGGAAMGSSDWALSRNGRRRSLAMKEKDGMQLALMNLSVMAKLFLERKSFAEFYIEKIEEYDIRFRHYDRIDKKLFDESLRGKAREKAQAVGNRAKEFMVAAFKSLVGREPLIEVQKDLQGWVGDQVTLPEIRRVFWAGDGTYIDFGDFWFELRASGTDAVLRFYIEGKEKPLLDKVNRAFVAMADGKIRELTSSLG